MKSEQNVDIAYTESIGLTFDLHLVEDDVANIVCRVRTRGTVE